MRCDASTHDAGTMQARCRHNSEGPPQVLSAESQTRYPRPSPHSWFFWFFRFFQFLPVMPTLTVICGPMFAGKTTALLRHIHSARASGKCVLVVKPERDTRYASDEIVTHTGERVRAHNAQTARDILPLVEAAINRPSLVAIDEIHFFASEAVGAIDALLSRGIAVVVAGCDIDHFGELFTPFDALLPRAHFIDRKHGTCARCGAPSTHSERIVTASDRIIVGGANEFVATCASCFRPSRRGMS